MTNHKQCFGDKFQQNAVHDKFQNEEDQCDWNVGLLMKRKVGQKKSIKNHVGLVGRDRPKRNRSLLYDKLA